VDGDVADVVGEQVVAAAHEGQGASGGDQAEGGAWADADFDDAGEVGHAVFGGGAGGHDQAHDVVGDQLVDRDLLGEVLQRDEPLGVQDGLGLGRGGAHPLDDLQLFLGGGVADLDPEQEAVALHLGQGVDAFGFDGVLGGQHDEGLGEGVGFAGEGDLAFGHDLQQRGLDFGGGAV